MHTKAHEMCNATKARVAGLILGVIVAITGGAADAVSFATDGTACADGVVLTAPGEVKCATPGTPALLSACSGQVVIDSHGKIRCTAASATTAPACSLTATPSSITPGGASSLKATCSPVASSYVWTGGSCAGNATDTCVDSPAINTNYTVAGHNAVGTGAATPATVTVTGSTPTGKPVCSLAVSSGFVVGQILVQASCVPAATSYTWTGTGFAIMDSSGYLATPSTTTTYYVVGHNSAGDSAQASATYSVTASCTLAAKPSTIGLGDSSTLTASCTPAATGYNWNGACAVGNTTNNCTVTPAVTTPYTVTGTGTNTATGGATVTVTQPSCTLTATPSTIGLGDSSTLAAVCSPAVTVYNWNGACAGTGNTCTVTPVTTGANPYTVTGTGANTATGGATVTVAPPSCTLTADYTTIAPNGTSTLTASCSPAAASYAWTGGTCAGNPTNTNTCTVTLASGSVDYTVTGSNAAGTSTAAVAKVTVITPGICAQSNTNYQFNFPSDFGKNFQTLMSRGQSVSFQFTTGAAGRSGVLGKEMSNVGSLTQTFMSVSASQCDFIQPNPSAWDGCSLSGPIFSLRYIVEDVNSNTYGSCSLKPNTTYYVNHRNENFTQPGVDTCPAGATCGFLFGMN
jgi:hypothetical protein